MKNFLILTKEDTDRMKSFLEEIIQFLVDNGADGRPGDGSGENPRAV